MSENLLDLMVKALRLKRKIARLQEDITYYDRYNSILAAHLVGNYQNMIDECNTMCDQIQTHRRAMDSDEYDRLASRAIFITNYNF
jgi:hypothetical protein